MPPALEDEHELLRGVAHFLESRGHIQAMWALEKESGVSAQVHGRDVAFVRELLMDGAFEEAQLFLKPLQGSLTSEEYGEALFVVRRQQFLELLSGQGTTTPAVDDLVQALKPLEPLCSPQSFHQLCFCLTLPTLTDHPDLRDWTVHGGRLDCFKRLLPHLSTHFPGQISRQQPPQHLRLANDDEAWRGAQPPLPPPVAAAAGVAEVLPNLPITIGSSAAAAAAAAAAAVPGVGRGGALHVDDALNAQGSVRIGGNSPAFSASPRQLSPRQLSPRQQSPQRASPRSPVRTSPPPRAPSVATASPTRAGASRASHVKALPRLSQPVTVMTPGCPVRTASFRPDGKFFAVGTNDRSLSICSIADAFFDPDTPPSTRSQLVACVQRCPNYHLGSVYCVEWNHDGSLIATSGNDKRVRIAQFHEPNIPGREGERLTPCLLLEGHNGTIRDLSFGAGQCSGRVLTAGAGDCIVRVWNVEDASQREPELLLNGHTDAVWSVTVDATGRNALTASQDGIVSIWDLRTGELAENLRRAERACSAEVWPSSPFHVGATYSDGAVVVWDVRSTSQPAEILFRHSKESRSIESVAQPAPMSVTSSFDGTAAVHAMRDTTFEDSYSLPHPGRVVRARWHPVHHSVLACTDSSVVMWVSPTANETAN